MKQTTDVHPGTVLPAGGNAMTVQRCGPSVIGSNRSASVPRRARRIKGWVLAMLENRQAPIFCAWLRSRRARKRAAPLTRLARRGLGMGSGRRASRHFDARSPRGVEQRAGICWQPLHDRSARCARSMSSSTPVGPGFARHSPCLSRTRHRTAPGPARRRGPATTVAVSGECRPDR